MKKYISKRITTVFLSMLLILALIHPAAIEAKAADQYTNIVHKVNTAQANSPVRYNFTLEKDSDIYFKLRVNERTTASLTVKTQRDETPVQSDTLPASDSRWEYISSTGGYQNTHTMHLAAGDYILEMYFESEVNYDLSISQITETAKLNYTSLNITKGFTKQLKVEGGKIESCKSSKKTIVTVSKSGKITAKSTGKAKISVKLTNGRTLTCNVTVMPNKYSQRKLTVNDLNYNTYKMEAYAASFDSKGNLVVKFMVVNNSYGKITNIPKFKITVKNSKKNTVVSYSKNNYEVKVDGYDDKSCTIKIPKSSFKTNQKKIDLRTCTISITGESADASL